MATTHRPGTTLRDSYGDLVLVLGHSARFAILLRGGGVVAVTSATLDGYAPVVGVSARPVGEDRERAVRVLHREAVRRDEMATKETQCGRRTIAAEHAEIASAVWAIWRLVRDARAVARRAA